MDYNPGMKKKVIFVCTANYYRSRYAEHYFNWLAGREQLGWKADSRGLMVGFWGNLGPISHHTVDALQRQGIPLEDQPRDPQPLTLDDLAEADLVVAVKEAEHRAMMAEQFPLWQDRIEYWHVDDLDCAEADEALPHLEQQIHALVERLRGVEGNGESYAKTSRTGILATSQPSITTGTSSASPKSLRSR
jgi:protein-tyrosine phosphatase